MSLFKIINISICPCVPGYLCRPNFLLIVKTEHYSINLPVSLRGCIRSHFMRSSDISDHLDILLYSHFLEILKKSRYWWELMLISFSPSHKERNYYFFDDNKTEEFFQRFLDDIRQVFLKDLDHYNWTLIKSYLQ